MLEFSIDNIFVHEDAFYFQQTVCIIMGTNCAPLLFDLFFHSYEADFVVDLIQRKEHRLARSFNLNFHYNDDVLSLNNPNFGDFIYHI